MGRTVRDLALIVILSAVVTWPGLLRFGSHAAHGGSSSSGDNVVLVVADGLRWQEVFTGADSSLLFGSPNVLGGDPARVRNTYWRADAAQRRAALMPFLWGTLVRRGELLGNRGVRSAVTVTNGMWFSYPGYNEMLVGRPDDARIDANDVGPNPNVTVFEWLNRRADFRGRVGAVGMWRTFHDIFNTRRSGLFVRDGSTDAGTHAIAMRYLREHDPRVLFVGYGETDDFAHQKRYDKTLDAAHAVDAYVAELWSALQSMPRYRGRTTLIVTADHGRGRTPNDWPDHGRKIPGSNETWLAVIGPHTPSLGESRGGSNTLSQIAATVAALVGADYHGTVQGIASPVSQATHR